MSDPIANLPAEAEVEAMELMTGGPCGDGIGPRNTAMRINEKYGTRVTGREMWALWKKYLPEETERPR